jgi:hypothetical protein
MNCHPHRDGATNDWQLNRGDEEDEHKIPDAIVMPIKLL